MSNQELKEFFEFVYSDVEGYVWAPVKTFNGGDDKWESHWFNWPVEKDKLIQHTVSSASRADVYYSTALYKDKDPRREFVRCTNIVWAEFDGSLPEDLLGVPEPSWRIRSSIPGHEHWLWRLTGTTESITEVERINRSISHQLGADASGWDATQILRAPGTTNNKSGNCFHVETVQHSTVTRVLDDFGALPVIIQEVSKIELGNLPDALNVIAKYKWRAEDFEFFRRPTIQKGSRSAAMMRLAFLSCEMGLDNEETYSILKSADDRWGKFKNRKDRERRLLDLINKARQKYPYNGLSTGKKAAIQVFGFMDLIESKIEIEWMVPDLLEKLGSLLLSGPPGTGKTQISLRFAMSMALGKDFIGFPMPQSHRSKIIFISMEMHHAAIRHFLTKMMPSFTEEERHALNERFLIVPLGHGLDLGSEQGQAAITRILEEHEPDGIIYDSLGKTVNDDLSSDKVAQRVMGWDELVRAEFGIFTWYVHHNRKSQIGNKKPRELGDVFGSQYFTANPTTVLGLWPEANTIEVSALKIRLGESWPTFAIERTDHLDFARSVTAAKLLAVVETKTKQQEAFGL